MCKLYPKFNVLCAHGDAEAVEALIAEARAAEDPAAALIELLETRASMLRLPPISCCVGGARISPSTLREGGAVPAPDHLRVARALIDAGCRLEAKDVAGHTPLHHCTTSQCTPRSLDIASLLIARGASVEATMRAGMRPICAPVMSRKLDAVTTLLGGGADADARLDMGMGTPMVMTPRTLCYTWHEGKCAFSAADRAFAKVSKEFPASAPRAIIGRRVTIEGLKGAPELNGLEAWCGPLVVESGRYQLHLVDEPRVVAVKPANVRLADGTGGNAGDVDDNNVAGGCVLHASCAVCGEASKKLRMCSGCKCAYYCGAACQKRDWKELGHKERCGAAFKSGCTVFPNTYGSAPFRITIPNRTATERDARVGKSAKVGVVVS